MTDYTQLKVPDLKKLLQERSLPTSGNKADLIARLQENDKKPADSAGAGEDEIDWDEEDNKATTAPAAAAVAAGGQGRVANPVAVPNQKLDEDPAKTNDLKVAEKGAPATEPAEAASSAEDASKPAKEAAPEAPKQDFSIGLGETDAEKEARKREERAKRFGIVTDDETKKREERAKKFGLDSKETIVKGLDAALPERRPKRGREGRQGGRDAKRQTPDRKAEPAKKDSKPVKKPLSKITDDPSEKAKAEARAKRFAVA
ncbi:hypothetical protein F5884DRAFT_203598 [Xylogone sp. PMI_703]|nr:hypothetical protein F5884DRAFT_203598 [Xylogone sp. PMI_703]